MTITAFGFFYFVCTAFAYCKSYNAVAYLFAFSYLFQTSAVLFLGGTGFMPYLFAPIVLIVKGLKLHTVSDNGIKNIQKMSVVFIAFVIIQSFVAFLFFDSSVKVYTGGGMESALSTGKMPFHFSSKQIIQWLYLVLNMGGMISLLKHRHYLSIDFSKNIVFWSVSFVLLLGFWKYFVDNVGGWFPNEFLFNNTSYNLANIQQIINGKMRFTSIFTEASVCGAFLSLFWWNIFFMQIERKKILLVATFVCLVLSLASTGFFCMGFGFALYLLWKRNLKFLCLFILSAIAFYVALQYTGLDEVFFRMTLYKSSSESAEARSAIMKSGLDLFKDTYGIGCGLGSSTAAGLATTLLGQLGLLGIFGFVLWLYPVFRLVKKNGMVGMRFCILLCLFGMCISIGYLSYPIFWMELIIATCSPGLTKDGFVLRFHVLKRDKNGLVYSR